MIIIENFFFFFEIIIWGFFGVFLNQQVRSARAAAIGKTVRFMQDPINGKPNHVPKGPEVANDTPKSCMRKPNAVQLR